MVGATFENDLGEMSRRWEVLKLIDGCVPSVRRDSTSPTSMRNKEITWFHGIRETSEKTRDLRLQIRISYYAVRLTGIPRHQNNKAIWQSKLETLTFSLSPF